MVETRRSSSALSSPSSSPPSAKGSKTAEASSSSTSHSDEDVGPTVEVAWGKLLSQCSQNPHVVMHHPTFTVGQGRQCDLCVRDPTGGGSVNVLEITGEKGTVKVNGKVYSKDSTIPLNGGDEVVFSMSCEHAYLLYILYILLDFSTTPSVSILDDHGRSIQTLASLSKELSILPASPDGESVDQGSEIPFLPSSVEDAEMKDAPEHNDGPDASVEKTEVASPSMSIAKRRKAFKDGLRRGLIDGKNIETSFDNFPYYLSETTKNVLIASTYIRMKCHKYAKFTSDLPALCPRILLSGPADSEIYQETLIKALAKYFDARLLVVDTFILPGGPITKDAATSKGHTFKKGDSVKYMGPTPSGQTLDRGPSNGNKGKVVLAFEENGSSKIGVRFHEKVPEGNDLGGLCEEDHGFLCAADLLCLDGSNADDVDKLAINEIFEIATIESEDGPMILFLKDMEKMVGNPDANTSFRDKLESLHENLVVIASHTETDSKVKSQHRLLYSKFGSNQRTLLRDNGRLHDRTKELAITIIRLSRLFPNKVTIQITETLRQQLDS